MTEKRDHLLDLEMRRRLYRLVQAYPGLHEREAARQLKASQALIHFHRGILEETNLITVERATGNVRMYATGPRGRPSAEGRQLLAALRNRLNLKVMLVLLSHAQPMRHGDIVELVGMSKSKLSFYLRKLEEAGLVRKTGEGLFEVREPRRVNQILTKYRPTPDLLAEFADLWSQLYDV